MSGGCLVSSVHSLKCASNYRHSLKYSGNYQHSRMLDTYRQSLKCAGDHRHSLRCADTHRLSLKYAGNVALEHSLVCAGNHRMRRDTTIAAPPARYGGTTRQFSRRTCPHTRSYSPVQFDLGVRVFRAALPRVAPTQAYIRPHTSALTAQQRRWPRGQDRECVTTLSPPLGNV